MAISKSYQPAREVRSCLIWIGTQRLFYHHHIQLCLNIIAAFIFHSSLNQHFQKLNSQCDRQPEKHWVLPEIHGFEVKRAFRRRCS